MSFLWPALAKTIQVVCGTSRCLVMLLNYGRQVQLWGCVPRAGGGSGGRRKRVEGLACGGTPRAVVSVREIEAVAAELQGGCRGSRG